MRPTANDSLKTGHATGSGVTCYVWDRSQSRLDTFLEVLPRFGAGTAALNDWGAAYAEGQGVDRIAWDVAWLNANAAFSSCLNVGGAPYIFEYFMRQARPSLHLETIDLDKSRFAGAENALGIRIHDIDIEAPDRGRLAAIGTFDCICFCEIFEHLRLDPLSTMSALRERLNDNGLLYLTTPNGVSFAGLRRFVFGRRTGPDPLSEWSKLSELGHMGHMREYSLSEVRAVLEHCGFSIEHSFYRFGLRRGKNLNARLRNGLQRVLTALWPSLANELVVVARKRDVAAAGQLCT